MSNQNENPAVVKIVFWVGAIASLITIFMFFTGRQRFQDILKPNSVPIPTNTPTSTATHTSVLPIDTSTATPTSTATYTPTSTDTPTPTPTNTLAPTPTPTTPPNYVLKFDGADDGVVVPASPLWSANEITLEAWVRIDSTASVIIVGQENCADAGRFKLATLDNADGLGFGYYHGGDRNRAYVSKISLPLNTWFHVAVVHAFGDGASTKLFLDGQLYNGQWLSGTGNELPVSGDRPIGIGRQVRVINPNCGQAIDGYIDEVRIWNVARTQTEIQADMRRVLRGDEPGLIGYWKFDEGKGQTVRDSTPNNNSGLLGVNGSDPDWVELKR